MQGRCKRRGAVVALLIGRAEAAAEAGKEPLPGGVAGRDRLACRPHSVGGGGLDGMVSHEKVAAFHCRPKAPSTAATHCAIARTSPRREAVRTSVPTGLVCFSSVHRAGEIHQPFARTKSNNGFAGKHRRRRGSW